MTGTINLKNLMPMTTAAAPSKNRDNKKASDERFQDMVSRVNDAKDTDLQKDIAVERPKDQKTPDTSETNQPEDEKKEDTLKLGEIVLLTDLIAANAQDQTTADLISAVMNANAASTVAEDGKITVKTLQPGTEEVIVQGAEVQTRMGNQVSAATRGNSADQISAVLHPSNAQASPVETVNQENKTAEPQLIPSGIKEQPLMTGTRMEPKDRPGDAGGPKLQNHADQTATGHLTGNAVKESAPEVLIQGKTETAETQQTDKNSDDAAVRQGELQSNQPQIMETISVKVGEPFKQMSQSMADQLADKITSNLSSGKQEFNIQLNPENLGKIAVKISVLESGIKVVLSCENPKTMELLTERAGGISRIVEQNTGNQAVVEVKEGYWQQQKNATDQHGRQHNSQAQDQQQHPTDKGETDDFIQQLRLGFYDSRSAI